MLGGTFLQKNKGKGEIRMKTMRRAYGVMLGLALVMACSSCGGEKEQTSGEEPAVETTTEATEATTEASTETSAEVEATENPAIKENGENTTQESQKEEEPDGIEIYFGDENAENIEKEVIEKQDVTPELLLEKLVSHDILTNDVSVNSFREVTTDGKKTLELDFSKEFQELVYNQGSSGEYIMIGSVVNTFLDAYDAENIKITVDGNILESGHNTYEGPQGYFDVEDSVETVEE